MGSCDAGPAALFFDRPSSFARSAVGRRRRPATRSRGQSAGALAGRFIALPVGTALAPARTIRLQLTVPRSGPCAGAGRSGVLIGFCAGGVEHDLAGGVLGKFDEGLYGARPCVSGADFCAQRRFLFVDKPGRPPFHVE